MSLNFVDFDKICNFNFLSLMENFFSHMSVFLDEFQLNVLSLLNVIFFWEEEAFIFLPKVANVSNNVEK